ncbi:IS630 transposase-related protein [Aquibium oceanicum]|uniref:IS630 transposase-related protein n=1 Tax=Aquibium oceanicum TaxID=1670800 RepID=UPI0009F9F3AC
MARALGEDLRSRVSKAVAEGTSARQASARFGVGGWSAIRWIGRARLGETAPRPQGRRRGSRLDGHADFIVGMIEEHKDVTLKHVASNLIQDSQSGAGVIH